MVHAFNPSIWKTEVVDLSEVKDRLNYIVSIVQETPNYTISPCFRKIIKIKNKLKRNEFMLIHRTAFLCSSFSIWSTQDLRCISVNLESKTAPHAETKDNT